MGNCAPKTHMMRSVMSQNHPWWKALAELVDNSFDAGATSITIECDNRTLSISDNGCGVSDVSALLTLGKHVDHKKTQLGVFGIGAKDAWLSCSDVMEVITCHNGVRSHGVFDINQIIENNWEYPDPTETKTGEKPYTMLRFRLRKDKELPGQKAFDELAWVFTPAISSGRSITLCRASRTSVLAPTALPPLTEIISDTFQVDGRGLSIEVGLVKKGHAVSRGPLWLILGHRIIEKTNLGCGNYSTMGVAGSITLHPEWRPLLMKNKDGMSANQDSIGDAILERIEPLLKKAQSLSEDIESTKLRHELEEKLNSSAMLAAAKGDAERGNRRQKRNSPRTASGGIMPVGTPRKIQTAEKVHEAIPGTVTCAQQPPIERKRNGFRLDYCEIDEQEIGDFLPLTNTVRLNIQHPFIAAMKKASNMPSLYSAAVALITDHGIRKPDGKPVFVQCYESFARAYGEMMVAFIPKESGIES
jgi:hypothetical protein